MTGTSGLGGEDDARTLFRPELEGLRAFAAILVVIYHVWLGRVSGGVDVFFLVSGFLITGQVTRGLERGERVVIRVWIRMARRLLPSVAVVLLAVAAVSVALLPQDRWFQTIREVAASALFVENWELARNATDYFARHDEASVLQHFWSLSVQAQFYLLWPLVVAVVARTIKLSRLAFPVSFRPALGAVIAIVICCSLTYSVHLTTTNQQLAYFDFRTRAWEFALGALLALMIDAVVLPGAVRVVAGWVGVCGLAACGLVLHVDSLFPGYAALWPTLSAAAVLFAGQTSCPFGVDRLLASGPWRYLGRLGFGWYLWHWPVLLFFLVAGERTGPGLLGGAIVIAVSLALAVLTHRYVEVPLRTREVGTNLATARLVAATLVPVLLAAGAWELVSLQRANTYSGAVDDADHPGALALQHDFEYWGAPKPPLQPAFVRLPQDWATTQGLNCSMSPRGAGLEVCISRTNGPPSRRVIAVGDSHPTQFLAALRPIAAERNWELIVMSRGGCAFSTDSEIRPHDQSCLDWNGAAMDEILAERPDFVFTMATRDVRVGLTERTPPGYIAQWRRLAQDSIPVLAVRDNPRFSTPPSACVELHGAQDPRCGTRRAEILAPAPPYQTIPDLPENVEFLDFSDFYCDHETCPPVIGNVLVYMDDNHVSATYITTMTAAVAQAIDQALIRYGPAPS